MPAKPLVTDWTKFAFLAGMDVVDVILQRLFGREFQVTFFALQLFLGLLLAIGDVLLEPGHFVFDETFVTIATPVWLQLFVDSINMILEVSRPEETFIAFLALEWSPF